MVPLMLVFALVGVEAADPSPLIDTAPESVKFLQRFGYLQSGSSTGASAPIFSKDSVEEALKLAQRFGGIEETGKLDNNTVKLFSSKRCGRPDIERDDDFKQEKPHEHHFNHHRHHNHRHKRYVKARSSWTKRHLTYYLTNWSPYLARGDVLNEIRKALDTWGRYSGLEFSPVSYPNEADFKLGFYSGNHGDSSPFDGEGGILAHAFYPPSGDVHFDSDEQWAINPSPHEHTVDFATVLLHELGHSLGLSHSDVAGSIMNPYYKGKGALGYDDIMAMYNIYVTRALDLNENDRHQPHHPLPTTPKPKTTTEPSCGRGHPCPGDQPEREGSVDGCIGGFNTVAYIRGELFVVKNNMLWRLNGPGDVQHGYPIEVSSFFSQLPRRAQKLDAMYQREWDSSIVFFSGKEYYVYDGYNLIEGSPRPITDYGLPREATHVDAVAVLHGKTHLFRGNKYWVYDDREKVMTRPRPVSSLRLPSNLDAALTYKNATYFFKNDTIWVLSTGSDSIVPHPAAASDFLLSCHLFDRGGLTPTLFLPSGKKSLELRNGMYSRVDLMSPQS